VADDTKALHLKIQSQELEIKHLNNELKLLRREYDDSSDRYFDIYSNMEEKVREKTLQLVEEVNATKLAQKALLFTRFSIDNAQDSFLWLDSKGQFFDANQTACRVLGYSREELLALSVSDLCSTNGAHFQEQVQHVNTGGSSLSTVLTKKLGEEFPADIYVHRFNFENKEFKCCIVHDMTEARRNEAMVIQAQKMETVGNLAGGLAHDFNNVLSGIRASLSMIKFFFKTGDYDPDDFYNFLEIADTSSERAANMVQQLLSLSQKHELHLSSIDLSDAVRNILNICQNTLPKEVDYKVVLPDSRVMVIGDQTQLEQVLLNLCVNASHAMTFMRDDDSFGGSLTISISGMTADQHFCRTHTGSNVGDYWLVRVCDTGVGMDPETLATIFDPFFSTNEKGRGTGLGLAMVYSIVTQHGGFIDVYSEPGAGTTFNVFLPVEKGALHLDSVDEGERSLEAGGGTILVVDDEDLIRQTTRLILRECGYEVLLASDGKEGVELYRENYTRIDAVILDMAMPKLCGRDAFIEMKAINPNIKALMASGFKQDERVEHSMAIGVKDFLQKPFSIYELASKIKSVVAS